MIYRTHIHNYSDSFIAYTFVSEFFAFTSAFVFIQPCFHSVKLCLLLQKFASSQHLQLQGSCHSKYLVSLVLDIRLNTLTFVFNNIGNT